MFLPPIGVNVGCKCSPLLPAPQHPIIDAAPPFGRCCEPEDIRALLVQYAIVVLNHHDLPYCAECSPTIYVLPHLSIVCSILIWESAHALIVFCRRQRKGCAVTLVALFLLLPGCFERASCYCSRATNRSANITDPQPFWGITFSATDTIMEAVCIWSSCVRLRKKNLIVIESHTS